ncbi:MAG: hypothetical protein RIM23_04695 [Coleofasciculus sp. G3-WIS-01]|uniref:hypothetical protein n=1 Tax=Coleofasciculus sp. G3-WIS-01 TaxID=3069528 RepID=UPI0032F7079F
MICVHYTCSLVVALPHSTYFLCGILRGNAIAYNFKMPFTEQVSAQVQQLLAPKVAERNQFAALCLTARIQVE